MMAVELQLPSPCAQSSPDHCSRFLSPSRVQPVRRNASHAGNKNSIQVHRMGAASSASPQSFRIDQIRKQHLGSRHGSPGPVSFIRHRGSREFDLESASAEILSGHTSPESTSQRDTESAELPHSRIFILRHSTANDSDEEVVQSQKKHRRQRGVVLEAPAEIKMMASRSMDAPDAPCRRLQEFRSSRLSFQDKKPAPARRYIVPLLDEAMAELDELDRDSIIDLRRSLLGSRNGSVRRQRRQSMFEDCRNTEDDSVFGSDEVSARRSGVTETRRSILGSRNGSTVPAQTVQDKSRLRRNSEADVVTETETFRGPALSRHKGHSLTKRHLID